MSTGQPAVRSDPARQAFQDNVTFPESLPPSFLRVWMASWFRDTAKEYPACRWSLPKLQVIKEKKFSDTVAPVLLSHLQRQCKIRAPAHA